MNFADWIVLLLLLLSLYVFVLLFFLLLVGSFLRWQENGRDEGISIPWQNISLHAISNTPVKCIYIMLDARIDYPCGSNGNGRGPEHRNGDDDDDDEGTCEGTFQIQTKIESSMNFSRNQNSIRFSIRTDDEPEMTEIWFTPTDETTIEDIFESMKHCQSLHPDANGKIEWLDWLDNPHR